MARQPTQFRRLRKPLLHSNCNIELAANYFVGLGQSLENNVQKFTACSDKIQAKSFISARDLQFPNHSVSLSRQTNSQGSSLPTAFKIQCACMSALEINFGSMIRTMQTLILVIFNYQVTIAPDHTIMFSLINIQASIYIALLIYLMSLCFSALDSVLFRVLSAILLANMVCHCKVSLTQNESSEQVTWMSWAVM